MIYGFTLLEKTEKMDLIGMMEKTFIILKPDTVQRGLVGEIIPRFEKVGLKLVAVKMIEPDLDHYHLHYEEISKMISRRGQEGGHLLRTPGQPRGRR